MREPYRLLDLFSGIGGFSLGLERTGGFKTVAFCEIEEFPRRVLAKHWPEVPCYHDIRELTAERLAADGIAVDAICGGFPCQDISSAGAQAGIGGARSGLWSEMLRLIATIRPNIAVIENVRALLGNGLDRVLHDLAAIGFDAEWQTISAAAVGAPHLRERVWIVAYPQALAGRRGVGKDQWHQANRSQSQDGFGSGAPAYASPVFGLAQLREQQDRAVRGHWRCDWRDYAASLRGMDDGVPGRVDGLSALGNAVVPQIPELIGRAILEAECLHAPVSQEAA